ncbi:RNA polymerase-associated protein rtf1 [Coemansia sp. RSA 2706]|nr:RNA polymerase-associated protein rtf1 [Coemansia sp. RSA 2711]KAJ2306446.1 RNA polymerase-associated protein rtf1 [Coemansia sp. RSA 2706]KAJ2311401.1 RNA polymerase-associated protein rtf1 [Coemansia sp. RSA 2705]KAJ2318867.1 RNA polymerase-associated protein rtf1 [Coemansia sp. RSA 2704]KAJ2328213.1 RNA polymerase-associated protein rtf1 [Coemansia sp. RSA 2702]KAJ2735422.1 RNA polymerase-associated protein rtf1 [Coemansia sp. Cherry 401B]
MDNLENDILELFEDAPGAGRSSERSRNDSRSKGHKRRRHGRYSGSPARRDDFSGSEDVDMDTEDDVDIEGGHARADTGDSDDGPVDEWGDDLMGDHKDRRHLASLPEIERERILAERQERRDVLNEQRELRLKLKAGVRVSGGDQRATRARRGNREAQGGSLSELRRERERRRHGEDQWSSSLSDEDAGSGHEAEPAASLEEINMVCLPRNQLEQWLFRPFLADAIKGCFVRIVTRIKDSTGEYNQYKMMEVMRIVRGEGRSQPPYHLNKTLTDKYLKLRFGPAEKDYSMETISNSPIKPEEYSSWEAAFRAAGIRTRVTAEHVQKKLHDLERARNYQLSDAEITEMISERNRLRRMEAGAGADAALERTQLLQLHTVARQNGDWAELKKLEARLAELDKSAKPAKPEHAPPANKPLLAPSSARGGLDAKHAARRKHLLSPMAGARRGSPAMPSTPRQGDAGSEIRFPVVPDLRVPELSLRSKVSPGYAQTMAENGGYDMSFLKL